jgi:ArsR family transcriptional regulator
MKPAPDDLTRMATVFKALGDTTRLRILALLASGEICVCHVHESLATSQPKASRHLAYLRRVGLVVTRRSGTWVYYRLADAGMGPLIRTVLDTAGHCLAHTSQCATDRHRLARKVPSAFDADAATGPPLRCCECSDREIVLRPAKHVTPPGRS